MQAATEQGIPAIAGGKPVKTGPYGSGPRYGPEELDMLRQALDQQTLFYAHGKMVKALEERIREMTGSKYAVAASSCTGGLHAAAIAAGISPGDEVVVTPITDMGSLAPILWQGAVPVFADVHPHSYCVTPESVEAVLSTRTRAVLAVHLWGNACDLRGLSDLCKRRSLVLIEDCAQAWGCTFDSRPVGSAGDIGCFSFNEFKHISCGDGGVAVTDDEDLARRLRLATDKCYSREHSAASRNPTFLAGNYRMTELQGAVALAQTEKLDRIVSRHRALASALTEGIHGIAGIDVPVPTLGCDPSWWFYMFRLRPEELSTDADDFATALQAEGISAGAHYIGQCVYEYPVFTNHGAFERGGHPYQAIRYGKGMCPIAESVLQTGIVLPINEHHTDQDVADTVAAIRKLARWFCRARREDWEP